MVLGDTLYFSGLWTIYLLLYRALFFDQESYIFHDVFLNKKMKKNHTIES